MQENKTKTIIDIHIRQKVDDLIYNPGREPISYDQFNDVASVLSIIESHTGIPYSDFFKKKLRNRKPEYVLPRQLFYTIIIHVFNVSGNGVAKFFGQNHVTAIHAIKRTASLLETNKGFEKITEPIITEAIEFYNKKYNKNLNYESWKQYLVKYNNGTYQW